MAPVSYYYFLSIILVVGLLLWLVNLVYLRKKGRTTFGQIYKVGTAEYRRVIKLASNRNIWITAILALIALANLLWSIMIVLRLDTPSAHFILVFAPVALAVLFPLIISSTRKQFQTNQFNKGKNKKGSRKHGKDNDSWLS